MHKYVREDLYIYIYIWGNDMNVCRGERCMYARLIYIVSRNEETKEDTKMKNESEIGDDWWKETKTVASLFKNSIPFCRKIIYTFISVSIISQCATKRS